MTLLLTSHSEQETERVGSAVGRSLGAGDVVLLFGDLGAGKTAFARGLVQGLAADPEQVSSPTFAIVQQYAARTPVFHADLYRLQSREVPDLGLDELAADGVLVVEWADRMDAPPPGAIEVRLLDEGGDTRALSIVVPDERQRSAIRDTLASQTT